MRTDGIALLGLSLLLARPGLASAERSAWERLAAVIGDLNVAIRHQEEITPAAARQPPFARETWIFNCGVLQPAIHYGRFLNSGESGTGTHPSLINGDMGIGFGDASSASALRYWYSIRVLVDGRDIFAEQTATRTETKSAAQGWLRLNWDLGTENRLVLTFTVPEDGHAVYARIDRSGPAVVGTSIGVQLHCYPGGFGPAYKLPSHRYALTARSEADVPVGGKENPVVAVTAGTSWVFYGDKLVGNGSLGLLFPPEERAVGQVQLSSYGQVTTLRYPAGAASCQLAFFAFDVEDGPARQTFLRNIDAELHGLRSLPVWPEVKSPSP